MAGNDEAKVNWFGAIMLGLLALLSLACILVGGFFYVWILLDWSQDARGFTGLQMIGWLFGVIAAAVIGVGLFLAGLLLRFFRWRHAALASLLLSIVSVGFILTTYGVFSDTGNGSDSIEVVLLKAACILGLFIVSLPPFLHWWNARKAGGNPAN